MGASARERKVLSGPRARQRARAGGDGRPGAEEQPRALRGQARRAQGAGAAVQTRGAAGRPRYSQPALHRPHPRPRPRSRPEDPERPESAGRVLLPQPRAPWDLRAPGRGPLTAARSHRRTPPCWGPLFRLRSPGDGWIWTSSWLSLAPGKGRGSGWVGIGERARKGKPISETPDWRGGCERRLRKIPRVCAGGNEIRADTPGELGDVERENNNNNNNNKSPGLGSAGCDRLLGTQRAHRAGDGAAAAPGRRWPRSGPASVGSTRDHGEAGRRAGGFLMSLMQFRACCKGTPRRPQHRRHPPSQMALF